MRYEISPLKRLPHQVTKGLSIRFLQRKRAGIFENSDPLQLLPRLSLDSGVGALTRQNSPETTGLIQ